MDRSIEFQGEQDQLTFFWYQRVIPVPGRIREYLSFRPPYAYSTLLRRLTVKTPEIEMEQDNNIPVNTLVRVQGLSHDRVYDQSESPVRLISGQAGVGLTAAGVPFAMQRESQKLLNHLIPFRDVITFVLSGWPAATVPQYVDLLAEVVFVRVDPSDSVGV